MGVSIYAHIVIGFPAKKVKRTTTVTRFNEETGEPYDKEVPDYTEIQVGNYSFSKEESETLFDGEKVQGLALFGEDDDIYLGVRVIKSSDLCYSQPAQIIPTEIPPAIHDFAPLAGQEPKLFFIPTIS